MMTNIRSGEAILAMIHPIYKRRYVPSTDPFVGCRIGCRFCYYRWGPMADLFQPGATLRKLVDAEGYWKALRDSRLVVPGDIVIFCARSDFSMPENRLVFMRFISTYYDPSTKPLKFLLLQRAPWSARDWKALGGYENIIFGTTITPEAAQKGFNRIWDDAQIRGLREMREAGCPPERISLELGPILPDTVEAAIEIAHALAREGIIKFLTYRGASVGGYGDYRAEWENLRQKGFWREEVSYTYFDGKGDVPHEYYRLKNHIPRETEELFLKETSGLPIRIYRHTGHLYAREWGASVAITRNNRLRAEMLPYARPRTLQEVNEVLEREFGITADVNVEEVREAPSRDGSTIPVPPGVLFRLHRPGTEDVAHAIGARMGIGVLFTEFRNQPSPADLDWYFGEGWLVPPESLR
ncbi:hypothetical protein [Thermoflexus sp.]|uniref:hypothetical protein n=1 Tax=Thermoflexus sp. TaxID=1969742 RepID=UPI002ADE077C|nr:hypothetical protein [Thermoflexus sp.]